MTGSSGAAVQSTQYGGPGFDDCYRGTGGNAFAGCEVFPAGPF